MKKNGRVYARVSDKELEQWDHTCRATGLSRSDLIRYAVSLIHRDGGEVAAAMLRTVHSDRLSNRSPSS